MIQAIVAVLPVPVAPSMVWKRSPALMPSESSAIAFGWSPVGWYASDVWRAVATKDRLAMASVRDCAPPVGERQEPGQRRTHLARIRPDRPVLTGREDVVAAAAELGCGQGPGMAAQQ